MTAPVSTTPASILPQNTTTPPTPPPLLTNIQQRLFSATQASTTIANRSIEQTNQPSFIIDIIDQWIEEGQEEERTARTEAKQRIETFLRNEEDSILYLDTLDLTTLPDIWNHPAFTERLTTLFLGQNKLSTLPDSIANLTSLEKISLYSNQFTIIPNSIGQLSTLTYLNLSKNNLQEIPDFTENLTNLTNLAFSNNGIQTIPESIRGLTDLTSLDLSTNHLQNILPSIGALRALERLDLSENEIQTIPQSIENLTALKYLNLSSNPSLTTVPTTLLTLPTSTAIYLLDCNLSEETSLLLQERCRNPEYRGPTIYISF